MESIEQNKPAPPSAIEADLHETIKIGAVILLLMMGIYVRTVDLSTHFTNVDDIGVAKTILTYQDIVPFKLKDFRAVYNKPAPNLFFEGINSLLKKADEAGALPSIVRGINRFYQWTSVPRQWTYAPLQFFATYALVHKNQTYREKIFWGRLPSAILGVLGLMAMVWFYEKYERRQSFAGILALTLLVFSWENIIYAKQMESYSVGVLFALIVLIMLISHVGRETLSLRTMVSDVLIFVVLCHGQYQVLFFVPAYFLTLAAYYWPRARDRMDLIQNFVLGGMLFGILIAPVYFTFLKAHSKAGITISNSGPSGEFKFAFDSLTFPQKVVKVLTFFPVNYFIVFGAMTGFVPEEHFMFLPVTVFLVSLSLLGAANLAISKEPKKILIRNFLWVASLTWAGLIILQKLTFGPTRHMMILLPFFCVMVTEGWNFLTERLALFQKRPTFQDAGIGIICGLIIFLFFLNFRPMVQSRKDPFGEDEIKGLLKQYGVNAILSTNWTWNLSLMNGIPEQYDYFEEGYMLHFVRFEGVPSFGTVAYISQRTPINEQEFTRLKGIINGINWLRQSAEMKANFYDYQIVYSKEIKSDVEIEFSKRTLNGTNNLFFYILKEASTPKP